MFYKTLLSLCFIKVFITIAYGESNPGYHGTGGDIQPDRPLIVGNCFDRIYAESVQCIAEAHRKWNLEFNYLAPVPGDPTTRESCCSGWQTFDCYEREITFKCNSTEQIAVKKYMADMIELQSDNDCIHFPYHSPQCLQKDGCSGKSH